MMTNDPNCGNYLKFFLVGGGGVIVKMLPTFLSDELLSLVHDYYIFQKFFHFKSFTAESKI